MPDLRHRDDSGHGYRHPRLLPSRAPWLFWMMLFPLLSGCGGGGGGGGSVGPHETAYVLAETTSGAGSVVAFAFDQTNGTFYSGTSTAATGGTPVQLLFSKGGGHLFVLNSSTGSGSSTGTVVSFAISSATGEISSSPSPVSTFPTGQSPTSMAVDPGGNYLVIANNGSSSNASIQVVSVSGGKLSETSYSPSPCKNPYRVVFAPGATGSPSDTFYVACSTLSSSATYSLVSCQISSTSCTPLYNSSGSDGYWTNLTLDPSNTSLVGVGTSGGSSSSGFLVVCTPLSSSPTCLSNTGTTVPDPSGNVAFSSSSGTEQVFIGNYLLGQSATNGYAFCTLKTPSCKSSTYSTSSDTSTPDGPIFLLGAGSQVYIAATVDTIDSGSSPSSGYLLSCPVSSSGSSSGLQTCASAQTAVDPVWITLDPSGNYLFVPTLSGELDVFGGVSSGNLSFAASSAFSGLQAISVTFQPSN